MKKELKPETRSTMISLKWSRITPFLFLLMMTVMASAQQIEVTGQVKDAVNKEVVPFCKVTAIGADSTIAGGGITDDKGFFKLPLKPGVYQIVTSFYGYDNDTIQAGFLREDKFLGVVRLNPSVMDLDEVNVEASSRIDMLDRDVQVITDQHKQGATAAKHVLDKVAGVSYDEYSGVLKVDNDANIMILVNGVEKSQEYIQNLEPERLLRVEITRDPGGRYGLEGFTALVNVILRNDYKGSELYVEQMQLVDIQTNPFKLDYMIGGILGTYNFTYNNLNIYAGANLGRRNFKIGTESTTEYDDGIRIEERATSDDPNAIILEYEADYTLGFDYRFNPKHLLSFESNISALPLSTDENTFSYSTDVFYNDTLIEQYGFNMKTVSKSLTTYNTLFYIADFNEKNHLNVNFTHSYFDSKYTSNSIQEFYYDRDEEGRNLKQYTRLYAELDHQITKRLSWQSGYGNTWRELKNEFNVDHLDLLLDTTINSSSDFRLSDMRHKLYTNFSWKINRRWGMRAGLAVETSSPRAEGKQLNYVIYQPLFDLRFVAGKKLNMTLKYRTTSDYPTIDQTNPFTSQITPRMTSTGNAFLRPSTTHRFSIRFNAFQGQLSLEPYTHYSNNTVVKIGDLDAFDVFNFQFENAELYQRSGAKLNFSKFLPISVLMQGNVEFYHAKIKSSSRVNELWDWRADIDVMYVFQKLESVLGLKYQRNQSKMINALGYEKWDVDFWMIFYQQPLFKKKGSIMFGYFLPLDLGANYNQDSHVENTGFLLRNDNDVSLVKNMFILEFSYRFGKGKSVKKMEKSVDKEEESGGGGMF